MSFVIPDVREPRLPHRFTQAPPAFRDHHCRVFFDQRPVLTGKPLVAGPFSLLNERAEIVHISNYPIVRKQVRVT
jgi:hypothetical protein